MELIYFMITFLLLLLCIRLGIYLNTEEKKQQTDEFDERFGFIKKYEIDSLESYNATKKYHQQNI